MQKVKKELVYAACFARWPSPTSKEKGAYAQTDLRARFLESKCPDKGNVRDFLDNLRVKREELASVGVDIDEKDYRSTIISSLPYSLANFASSQLAAARMFATSKTIAPDSLISLISEEYERQKTQKSRRSGKTKDDGDEAMVASSSSKKGKGKKKYPRGVCWNCGDPGHYKDKCPKPATEKPTKEPKKDIVPKKTESANAVESDSESEVAFLATYDTDSDESDGLGDGDWFDEVALMDSEELNRFSEGKVDESIPIVLDNHSPNNPTLPDALDDVHVAAESASSEDRRDAGVRAELYDSGCTKHISPYREDLIDFVHTPPKSFRAANKQSFSATGAGKLIVDLPNSKGRTKLELTNVQYSPDVAYTLVSVGYLDDEGFSVKFGKGKCEITNPSGEIVGEIPKNKRGLYRVEHSPETADVVTDQLTLEQFHRRMGHISSVSARKLVSQGLVTGVFLDLTEPVKPFFCESCVYAKSSRKPILKVREGERATVFGGEVHSDLWGPAPVESKGGKKYYITFTDDKTRLTHLYLLRKKDEAFSVYKEYEAWVDTQLSAKIKVLHSDRGGEYIGSEFKAHLKSKGTIPKLTVHDTPQHNGVAERRNRTIVERIRALLHGSGLPRTMWGEAARHVVWLMNRTRTTAVVGMTPYEAAFGKKPDLSEVREWGDKVWVRLEVKGYKLGGRVREGRWMGISDESKGIRVYWPDKKTVSTERNVYFDNTQSSVSRLEGEEWQFVETKPDNLPAVPPHNPPVLSHKPPVLPDLPPDIPPNAPETSDDDDAPSEPEIPVKRIRKPTAKIKEIMEGRAVTSDLPNAPKFTVGTQLPSTSDAPVDVLEAEESDDWMMVMEGAMMAQTSEMEALEPPSLAAAKKSPDWPAWEKAIYEELEVLKAAGTWKSVDPPSGANIVGSKWVFRAKKDAAGVVVRYKARLVAQGFSQVPGVDYFDTFAPVARLSSIRTVLAIAAAQNLEIHQIDIKGAYLNGELTDDEVIYMKQPPGYPVSPNSNEVLRLLKTLYGLKQAGRRWYQRLVRIMESLGFKRCDVDQAVFYRRKGSTLIIVLVHVDDCTIAGTSITLILRFKTEIAKFVAITDLGELNWILGIEVKRIRENRTIHLSQKSYIESMLRRYSFDDLKPVSLPMETSIRLTSAQSPTTTQQIAHMRNIPYQEAVGSLIYASLGTRPDITYAVQTVSCFSKNPGQAHWEAVKRIFRYLKGTKELWLSYGGEEKELRGYADADGSMAEDRHAISGYAFLLHGGAVSWAAKRQEIVSLSTTESEYVAVTHASKEALWLRSLITQLFDVTLDPTTLFSDNQSAIALTKDHQYHPRTKHIDIRFHFIRWIIENGFIRLIYCPTDDMLADTLTKALPSPKVKHFAVELGLVLV